MSIVNKVQALNIALGANISSHQLMVFHKDNGSKEVATLQGDYKLSPMMAIYSNPRYFGNTRFGWELELNVGVLGIDRQLVKGSEEDIDTSVSGAFGHFNPTLIYRLGDKIKNGIRKWSITGGTGYGLSYLILDGNFKETDRKSGNQKTVDVDKVQGAFLLPSFIIEGVWHNWFASLSSCFGGNGLEEDGYTYKLWLRSVNFGYSFTF